MPTPDHPVSINRNQRAVPVEFARLMLQMAAERGLGRELMLEGLDIPAFLIDKDGARLSINQQESLLRRAIDLSGNKGWLGYELGLRVSLTTHSQVGYALLSQVTLGEAIRFGIEFSQMAMPVYRGALSIEDDFAVLDVSMDVPVDDQLYRYAYDAALTAVWSGMRNLMGGVLPDVELWFNYPEPEYYAANRGRLPACRFDMGANQICFPVGHLHRRISTGEPVMAQLMAEKLERQRAAPQQPSRLDILTQVRQSLNGGPDGYPDLDIVAARLFMSTRTLKRKLHQSGSSFQVLRDEIRQGDAKRLLSLSNRSVEDIAASMGYADPGNFTHAFRRWTGMTPGEWRAEHGDTRSLSE